jgi:hypothetical protein
VFKEAEVQGNDRAMPRGVTITPQPSPLRLALRARLRGDGCGLDLMGKDRWQLRSADVVQITRCWQAFRLLPTTGPTRRYPE